MARVILAVIALAIVFGVREYASLPTTSGGAPTPDDSSDVTSTRRGAQAITAAFASERSGVWVETAGRVDRMLPDDNVGSRHQRFIVRLDNEHTVLISHNIDLAPRLPISSGERVAFRGMYEWNAQGGVVHWTHHDPDGNRSGGWLRYRGKLYR